MVFVAVAALVSGAVEIAVRRAQAAERARAEAETLSALAGPDLTGEESLHDVLRHALKTFRMESVALKVREPGSSEWVDADHAGWAPPGTRRRSGSTSRRARACGWSGAARPCSPRTSASSRPSPRRPGPPMRDSASAARPRRRATSPPSTSSGRRCWPRSATTSALRWPGSRRASARSARPTSTGRDEEREELLATIEDSADRLDAVVRNLLDASRLQAGSLVTRTEAVALDRGRLRRRARPARGGRPDRDRRPEDLPAGPGRSGACCSASSSTSSTTRSATAAATSRSRSTPTPGPTAPRSRSSTTARACRRRGRRAVRALPALGDRSEQGLGLGLSVARGFVEAMGGAMVADTTPGGGMTMRIRLQLERTASAAAQAPRP